MGGKVIVRCLAHKLLDTDIDVSWRLSTPEKDRRIVEAESTLLQLTVDRILY